MRKEEGGILHLYLNVAIHAAIEAAEVLRKHRREGFTTLEKADASLVTSADLAADAIIIRHLSSTGIPVLTEETEHRVSDAERAGWNRFWLVDPLDGTKEFATGRDEYTVNIALIENGRPSLGIIGIPEAHLCYMTHPRIGPVRASELDLKRFGASNTYVALPDQGTESLTAVVSRSHLLSSTLEFLEKLKAEHPDLEVVRAGSSLKFCRMAEGSADLYPRFSPCMLWDIAAGEALIAASGKRLVLTETGEVIDYRTAPLLVPPFVAE
jgi:3'(2'), 5'-bisphosphate nucleotidase